MNKTQETQVNCIKTTCLTTLTVLVGAAALWTLGGISPASAASNRAPLSAEPPPAILQEQFPHSPSDRIAVPVSETPATLKVDVDGQDDEPDILFSSHDGYLLFQSGPPNGVAGLSNVNGIVDGEWLDRALIDDFVLDGNAIVTAVGINGVWFDGTGGDTPLEGLRVRLWTAGPDGLPGELLFDDFVPHEAVETGDVYFGRPEIVYIAHLPDFELPGGGSIISIQPVGTLDGFFQLTAASGLDEIFGIEVHVSYPDLGLPPWTPGHVAFDEYHDVVFTVWGEWVTDGTETCEEWCGTQSPFGCWCDELCDEFDDCCEDVCEACEDELDFCDPGIDPYICDGYCGGPSPGGCWCDDWCDLFDDCCDDVCEECEDELDFCDDLFDPYVCEGYCGGMAPGGCWCDDWCDLFDDCCDDVCEECDDNVFCDPGIDPYICDGYCGDMAPGGCWCDEWCDQFNDCCDDVCEECDEDVSFCDPNIDPYDCLGELNGDGVVDGGDLLILLSNWGNCADPDDCPADLNDDGVVDGGDLLILLSNWGECLIPQTTFCFWANGTIALTFNPDDSNGEDVFTADLTPAFVPMCLKVQPGPYASGEDIAVRLTQARYQGLILAGDDEDDFGIGVSVELIETPPSSRGVITNVVANADGKLVSGDLYLEAHLRLNSSIGDFSNGLKTIGVPVVLHSPGMTGMFEVGQTLQMLTGEEPVPLFSVAPRRIVGSIADLVLTANEDADEEDKHECPAPGPGCQTSCPEIVIDPDKTESIIRGWRRGEASYGTRFRFRYNPAEPVCAHIMWSFTTDAEENGCNLDSGYTNQSKERNSKCSDPRRLDLEFVARLPASTQDPDECPCETISFLNIYCKDKDHPDAPWGEPIASIQVKWELLENGNVKVTVSELGDPDEVSGDEITTWHQGCEDEDDDGEE